MFKCVYKADMTEQQINLQKKARPGGYRQIRLRKNKVSLDYRRVSQMYVSDTICKLRKTNDTRHTRHSYRHTKIFSKVYRTVLHHLQKCCHEVIKIKIGQFVDQTELFHSKDIQILQKNDAASELTNYLPFLTFQLTLENNLV